MKFKHAFLQLILWPALTLLIFMGFDRVCYLCQISALKNFQSEACQNIGFMINEAKFRRRLHTFEANSSNFCAQ